MLECLSDAFDDGGHGGHRRISWIHATEHHQTSPTDLENFRVVVASGEFHGESADPCFHQLPKQIGVFILVLPTATGVSVAEVHDRGHMNSFKATVKSPGAVSGNFFVVAGH